MVRLFSRLTVRLLIILAIFAGGVYAGMQVVWQLNQQFSLLSRIEDKVSMYLNSYLRSGEQTDQVILTNRLRLDARTVFLPSQTADYAGGIDAVNQGQVVLLDRLGSFFLVSPDTVSEIAIEAPENGLDALRAQLAAGELGNATVEFKWFRFNDILVARNGETDMLLVSYTEWHPERRCFTSTLSGYQIAHDVVWQDLSVTQDDWRVVARTEPCLDPLPDGEAIFGLEAGGRLAQQPGESSSVFWTTGQYERGDSFSGTNFDTAALGMRDGSHYGRVLNVSLEDGSIVELARGLRNPQGLDVEPNGNIWVTDHGAAGGDELNLITEPGRNFGFPAVSYGRHYNGQPIGNLGRHGGHGTYDLPAFAFVPSVAPSAALVMSGFHPVWDGDIIVGAFSQRIFRVHVVDGRGIFAEPIDLGVRTRDMAMTSDGQIAIWTDDLRMIFVRPSEAPSARDRLDSELMALASDTETMAALMSRVNTCATCHSLEEEDHRAAPSLHGVCGRAVGSTDFGSYSESLATMRGTWETESLSQYINAPSVFAPGTSMGYGVQDEDVSRMIATALCQLREADAP
ncbi:PQQ-dependent sugar dehydrogenase [Jannaschia sp. CCS1]|uniref:PQQ-dependent sugar dehydrogenase n=1 Tax=Jannaschia sp. (strain CCS1) TaxID=290400 RepID=UPI000053BBA5|nr:PQQ-dependent sugar dehydrogenase [Jannaschia sp. CCS1]ABD57147.1 glucose sorbosone dehydrogenase [Jannaschia sp. CCS1]